MTSILVVEDDPHLARLLHDVVDAHGYGVECVPNGQAALAAAAARRPAAILLDVNLPDVDGFSLCTIFCERFGLPVILLTGRATEVDILRGFAHGADDYVTKPFNIEVLLARLRAVLRAGENTERRKST
jgi:DNA-binding response OmpR family regulator